MQATVRHDFVADIARLESEEAELADLARKLVCDDDFNSSAKKARAALAGSHASSLGVLVAALIAAKCPVRPRALDASFKADPKKVAEHLDKFLWELLSPVARYAATKHRSTAVEEANHGMGSGIFASNDLMMAVGDDVSFVGDLVEIDHGDFTVHCRRHAEAALNLIAKGPVSARAVNVLTALGMEIADLSPKPKGEDPDGSRHERIRKAIQRSTRAYAKK